MDIFDIRCFLSAAKHLSFSLAAGDMFISQPAMSARIKTVENLLGTKLFYRDSHKVELTPAGKLAYTELSAILRQFEDMTADLKKLSESGDNHLSISYNGPAEWAGVNELIQAFHRKYPQIELEIKIGCWGQLVWEVLNGGLDLIFTEQSEIQDVAGIESVFLFRDLAALAVSNSSPWAKLSKITPELLENKLHETNIVIEGEKSSKKSMRRIHERLSEAGLDMAHPKLVDNFEIAVAMASSGLSIAPIPRSFKVKGNQFVSYIDIDSDRIYLDFCLAWSSKNVNRSISLFRDFCMERKWMNNTHR
ncbi:MAG TPA: LysR family transcriptional regulator [Bellilinea sp.]|nr:LysR family transcriptional regulator [Bellilinea sp.]